MLATLIVNDLPALLLQETTTLEAYCRDIEAAALVFIRKSPEYATQIRAYAVEVKTLIEG
jgi:hypothetical protein